MCSECELAKKMSPIVLQTCELSLAFIISVSSTDRSMEQQRAVIKAKLAIAEHKLRCRMIAKIFWKGDGFDVITVMNRRYAVDV